MEKNTTVPPPFDVSAKGAMQKQADLLWSKFVLDRPRATREEMNWLNAAGYDPAQLYLVDRIGDTGIFMRLIPCKPILVHKTAGIRDLNKRRPANTGEEEE